MDFLSKIKLPAKQENFALIKNQIRSCLVDYNTSVETMNDIITAAHEAFNNACRFAYSDKNGFVTICLGVNNQQNKFYIIISDMGVGIKDIKKATEPFFTTTDDCSGMGFTIMQSFMDNLKVESSLGEGTSVKMSKNF